MLFSNAGLVLLAIDLPLMLFVLFPVAAIEAACYRTWLKVPFSRAWAGSLAANFRSTLLGLPLAWIGLFGWQIAVIVVWPELRPIYGRPPPLAGNADWAAWLHLTGFAAMSMPQSEDMAWMICAYTLVLMIPAYLISFWWEARVLCRLWPDIPQRAIWRACLGANSLSYLALAGITGWRLRIALAA